MLLSRTTACDTIFQEILQTILWYRPHLVYRITQNASVWMLKPIRLWLFNTSSISISFDMESQWCSNRKGCGVFKPRSAVVHCLTSFFFSCQNPCGVEGLNGLKHLVGTAGFPDASKEGNSGNGRSWFQAILLFPDCKNRWFAKSLMAMSRLGCLLFIPTKCMLCVDLPKLLGSFFGKFRMRFRI